eukprot:gene6683-3349_t
MELLAKAASYSLEATSEWCSHQLGTLSNEFTDGLASSNIWQRLLSGSLQVSPHLPLHRTAAMFMQALLTFESLGVDGTGGTATKHMEGLLELLRAPLDDSSCLEAAAGEEGEGGINGVPMCSWQPISFFILVLQAFIGQMHSRLWIRNGDDLLQLELLFQNWREFILDMDVLIMMAALAASPPHQAWTALFTEFNGKALLRAAGIRSGPPGQQSPLLELQDGTNLLGPVVCILRERSVCGLPPQDRLRHILLHWLCIEDWGYTQLLEFLPSDLQNKTKQIEEVLDEIATYRAPSLNRGGMYILRREYWRYFDPHFQHFSQRILSRAWERAMSTNMYKPHYQLLPPPYPLPPSLRPMLGVLATPSLYRLVWYIISTSAVGGPPKLPEEMLLSALNLLSLQLQHCLSDMGLTGDTAGPVPASANTAGAAGATASASTNRGEPSKMAAAHAELAVAVLAGSSSAAGYSFKNGGLAQAERDTPPRSSPSFSEDILDCCSHLAARCKYVLQVCSGGDPCAVPPGGNGTRGGASPTSTDKNALEVGVSDLEASRKVKAKQRQANIMAKMRAQQAAFLKMDPPSGSDAQAQAPPGPPSLPPTTQSAAVSETEGVVDPPAPIPAPKTRTRSVQPATGVFVQRREDASLSESHSCGPACSSPTKPWNDLPRNQGVSVSELDIQPGLHVHCCGHVIHSHCFEKHRQNIRETVPNRHTQIVSVARNEFLCPVCRRLANTLLPAADFAWRGTLGKALLASRTLPRSAGQLDDSHATPGLEPGPGGGLHPMVFPQPGTLQPGRLVSEPSGPGQQPAVAAGTEPPTHISTTNLLQALDSVVSTQSGGQGGQSSTGGLGEPSTATELNAQPPTEMSALALALAGAALSSSPPMSQREGGERALYLFGKQYGQVALILDRQSAVESDVYINALQRAVEARNHIVLRTLNDPTAGTTGRTANQGASSQAEQAEGRSGGGLAQPVGGTHTSGNDATSVGAAPAANAAPAEASIQTKPMSHALMDLTTMEDDESLDGDAGEAPLPSAPHMSWDPLVVLEKSVSEVQQQYDDRQQLCPSFMWALLAHNIAHYEALRRPSCTSEVLLCTAPAEAPPKCPSGMAPGTVSGGGSQETKYNSASTSQGSRSVTTGGILQPMTTSSSVNSDSNLRSVTGLPIGDLLAGSHSLPVCIAEGLLPSYFADHAEHLMRQEAEEVDQEQSLEATELPLLRARELKRWSQLVVYAVASSQASLWTLTLGPLAPAVGEPSSPHPIRALVRVLKLLEARLSNPTDVSASAQLPSTSEIREVASTQVLPFLVRSYCLYCLLQGQQPSLSLMHMYRKLRCSAVQQEPRTPPSSSQDAPNPDESLAYPSATRLVALLAHELSLPGVLEATRGIAAHPDPDHLVARWCPQLAWGLDQQQQDQAGQQLAQTSSASARLSYPLNPLSLIALPDLFQDLYLNFTDQVCPKCHRKPEQPGICLITGKLLCSCRGGCVDDRGGGYLHTVEHCVGNSMILSLKSTRVLSIRHSRKADGQSPFLDSHGEEDPDMRRYG